MATATSPAKPAKPEARMFPTRNDLPEDARRQVVAVLNGVVADLLDLYSQTKHAHWNLKGPNFIGLHKLLDELAEGVEGQADEAAERATALGGVVLGTVRMSAATTRLSDFPADVFSTRTVAQVLADRYAAAGKLVRGGIDTADALDDKATADLLTDVSRLLDKSTWLLESHVQLDDQPG
jgi:starvation-inducible DNA-binding protein